MTLPIITTPTYELKIPSSGKTLKYRPFIVKEEKILLMAAQERTAEASLNAIRDVINACTFNSIAIDKLPLFDLEYIFLQIRIKSKGATADLVFTCKNTLEDGTECNTRNEIAFNLEDIKVVFPEEHTKKVMITDNIAVFMKYPTLETTKKISKALDESTNSMMETLEEISEFIDYFADGEKVIDEFTKEELNTFIEQLSPGQFANISNFFKTMPKLRGEMKITCKKCGHKETVIVEGLQNFFL